MKTKTKAKLIAIPIAVAGLFGGTVALSDATAPAMADDYSRVCHSGPDGSAPVWVLEVGGAEYQLFPGDCTSGDVDVFAIGPVRDGQVTYRRSDNYSRIRTCSWTTNTQWCGTLGYDIDVRGTSY